MNKGALEPQHQFETFNKAFKYYFDRAKEQDPKLSISGLAKAVDLNHNSLHRCYKTVYQPKAYFIPEVERLEARLGAPNGALSSFLKFDGSPSSIFEKHYTYGDLIAYFKQKVAPALDLQQRRNELSSLAILLTHLGLADGDRIGPELGEQFEQSLVGFIEERKRANKSSGTINNDKSHLRAWKEYWDALGALEVQGQFESLHEAFKYYFDRANEKDPKLTLWKLAKRAGANRTTVKQFYTEITLARHSNRSAIEKIERILGTPHGVLLAFVSKTGIYSVDVSETNRTPFGRRQQSLLAKPYRLKEGEISVAFAKEFKDLLTHKTALNPHPLERSESWRLQPIGEYSGSLWFLKYCSVDGEHFSESGKIAFNRFRTFFGVLKELKDDSGKPKYDPQKFSLVYMADYEILNEVIEVLRARLGCFTRTLEGIYLFAQSLLAKKPSLLMRKSKNRKNGYLRQKPEFASKLPNPVDPNKWSQWCDKQHRYMDEFLATLSEANQIKSTREPKEDLKEYLDRQHPLEVMFELEENISQYLEDNPCLPEHFRKPLQRDLLLVQLITEQPLRIKMWRDLTYFPDNSGNLYRKYNGAWAIRFRKERFKNEKGAATDKDYDVELPPERWTAIEDYLEKIRPWFNSVRPLVFVSEDLRKHGRPTDRNTSFLARSFTRRTDSFLPYGRAFGPHAVRHFAATDYIKNHEEGFVIAAAVLHDTLAVVMKNYAHLKTQDHHNFYRKYLGELRSDFRSQAKAAGGGL